MRMQAVVYERYGAPSVLKQRELPAPEPRDREVRIAIRATTVTAACQMMRRGDTLVARLVLGLFRPRARFRVLGIEIAGALGAVIGYERDRHRRPAGLSLPGPALRARGAVSVAVAAA